MWLLKAQEDRTGGFALKAQNVFSDSDIDYLNWFVQNHLQMQPGKTGSVGGEGELSEHRTSEVAWLPATDERMRYYYEKIAKHIDKANADYYQMSLTGFYDIQYTVYPETTQGKYDWHTDTSDYFSTGNFTRKLSAVVALNDDFEGGVFETLDGTYPRSYDLKKGDIILFPSFVLHRVTPVTKGTRRSLVIWVMGPNFK